jgi:hypothetical protein
MTRFIVTLVFAGLLGVAMLALGPAGAAGIDGTYLMSFHACNNNGSVECGNPSNHSTYLAQSNDGATWTIVPGWTPYTGSVPDVIRRGDTIYIYTANAKVRRYSASTGQFLSESTIQLTDSAATGGYVDPSMILDDQGRLVMFYLLGVVGQDPAQCSAYPCTKQFHSATEVTGSDGAQFVAESGDRVAIQLTSGSASDPDVFHDGSKYVVYISRGNAVQVYTSSTLHGTYAVSTSLPGGGYLTTNGGGVPAGIYTSGQYWTYVTSNGEIKRATHSTLNSQVSSFTTVANGSSVGLGSTYRLESPGVALNVAGVSTTPTATAIASATASPTATVGPTATPAASVRLPLVSRNASP